MSETPSTAALRAQLGVILHAPQLLTMQLENDISQTQPWPRQPCKISVDATHSTTFSKQWEVQNESR